MPRTQLIISYRGTAYVGWQRQPNGVAVQEVVEEGLSRLLGSAVQVTAAGRTDAGVHARGQSVHLDHQREMPESAWVHGANRFLPDDIRIVAACPRADRFHARFDATAKLYRYLVSTAPVVDALVEWQRVRVPHETDFAAMNRAASQLAGEHEFAAFANAGGSHKTAVRTVRSAEWVVKGSEAEFRIRGDGFLRGMVRTIVGTLLEVGSGGREPGSLGELLDGRPRAEAGQTAAAKGLVLERVEYSSLTGENTQWPPA